MKYRNNINLLILMIMMLLAYFLGSYVSPILFAKKYAVQQEDVSYDFPTLVDSELKKNMPIEDIIAGKNDYWSNWDWENQMFYAGVSDFDTPENEVILYMMRPEDKDFSGNYRRTYEMCESVEIALTDADGIMELEGPYFVDSLEELYEVDDELYAYCIDEECLNIGKRCVLSREKT